jgi:hypothetical protein
MSWFYLQYQPEIVVFIIGQDYIMVSEIRSFKSVSSPCSLLAFTYLLSVVYNLETSCFYSPPVYLYSLEKFIGYFKKKCMQYFVRENRELTLSLLL